MIDYNELIEQLAELVDDGMDFTDALDKVVEENGLEDEEKDILGDKCTEHYAEESPMGREVLDDYYSLDF